MFREGPSLEPNAFFLFEARSQEPISPFKSIRVRVRVRVRIRARVGVEVCDLIFPFGVQHSISKAFVSPFSHPLK